LHDSALFQQIFGSIIVANFIIALAQSELVPEEGSFNDGIFLVLDLGFTGLFTIELLITFVAFAGSNSSSSSSISGGISSASSAASPPRAPPTTSCRGSESLGHL